MVTNNDINIATGVSNTVLQGQGVGTAAAFSTATYPATTTINQILYSSATNTVSGLATANSGVLSTSSGGIPSIDTTNFQVLSTGLQLKGNNTNTAPPSGFLGEQIRSAIASGSPVSISNNTATNITSISLTAGIWDVSCIMNLSNVTITGTSSEVSISTTSATRGTLGDSISSSPFFGNSGSAYSLVVPSYRVTLSTTTSVFLVGFALYTVGSLTAYGRISATRVG